MKIENLLRELNEINTYNDVETIQLGLRNIIEQLKKDLFAEEAKKQGRNKEATVIKKFLKTATTQVQKNEKLYMKAMTDNEAKEITGEDRQYFTNGYGVIVLKNAIPFDEAEDKGILPTCKRLVENASCNVIEVDTPDNAKLKAEIKIVKANMPKGKKCTDGSRADVIFDFGDELPCVNAEWLSMFLDVFPDCKIKISSRDGLQAIYFGAENGEGALLPVKCENKSASNVISL